MTTGMAWRSLRFRFMLTLACTWVSRFFVEAISAKADPSLSLERPASVAILLAAKDGPDGDLVLQEWSTYLRQSGVQATVWVVCLANTGRETLVDKLPSLLDFPVTRNQSWATAMRNFRLMNPDASGFGLLGEGVLPPPDLNSTILNVESAITAAADPTVVLARSRSRSINKDTPGTWLPDTFIAQLWCNRRTLTDSGLEDLTPVETSFLEMLPVFISAHREITGLVEVDGTSVVKATYDMPAGEWASLSKGNTAAADGGNLYLGKLGRVLIEEERDDNGQVIAEANFEAAPWPPRYVIDTVQGEDGLVILNSVNCGYLDFATNFLRSVRKVTDSKKEVMWVAMDEVAFDFMDALSPGTAVLFFYEGSERHHVINAGNFGDDTFKTQVLVRPNILLHLLNQGYTILWTDSDMVWLDNPLPLLPDMNDPEAAELLLQHDGLVQRYCTCFLYMKPTQTVKQLMKLWIQKIIDDDPDQDQAPFRKPLLQQLEAGMRMDIFPQMLFPSGNHFFAHPYEKDYAHVYYPNITIVHNNFISGHDAKLQRFQEYHLWDVENMTFPTCERRNRL